MATSEEKVICRTPTPGKQATRIDAWKFDLVRRAILDVVPPVEPGLPFKELPHEVSRRLTDEEREELGSLFWYTTTVKLELEVRGEIVRVEGAKPQALLRNP